MLEPLRFLADEFLTANPIAGPDEETQSRVDDFLAAKRRAGGGGGGGGGVGGGVGASFNAGTGGRVLKGAMKSSSRWSRVGERASQVGALGRTSSTAGASGSKVGWAKVISQLK